VPPSLPVVRSGYTSGSFLNTKESILSGHGRGYTPEQAERLERIHARLVEARRELDALIGDAYLRPRASIVPVHFLDLASAVEKLRWAEKEWRELEKEVAHQAAEEAGLTLTEEATVESTELVDAQTH
jgi:hypothetical protein